MRSTYLVLVLVVANGNSDIQMIADLPQSRISLEFDSQEILSIRHNRIIDQSAYLFYSADTLSFELIQGYVVKILSDVVGKCLILTLGVAGCCLLLLHSLANFLAAHILRFV